MANIDKTAKIGHNCTISENVIIEENVTIGHNCIINENVTIKKNTKIGNDCIIGEYLRDYFIYNENYNYNNPITIIGENSIIRSKTIIYSDNILGDSLETGHSVTIREKSDIGNNVRIGTLCDIQGFCKIGNYVRMHSNVHIGQESRVGNFVWIFPYTVLTNDPTPPSNKLFGVEIEDYAVIATGTIVLPNVKIGKNSFIGAKSLVNKNVEDNSIYAGNPFKFICKITEFKNKFTGKYNYPWMYNFDRGMPWENIGFENWTKENCVEL